ncbi:MgtC/SapB family protein [Winogradskyella ouciana]|uniref:MgtC/SapB family protein n=1 Tax=Winogradskyella ouciana TaxID=2608631 RepID=A0A7K1GBP5_9FLAO|nr:MgtC/SapB family protein [Winogradskyella ouciana]MTE26465.1 MgtC/SapB family protein [Winogradskyella ouciana]
METLSYTEFIVAIVVAMIAGVSIGIERQMKNKNAGLKTNALVAVGAAIFVSISYHFSGLNNVDESRILSQIIIGVGFLGAGVIIKKNGKVTGLATAASIWCSAGLGCLAAMQMYKEILAATLLIIGINLIFGALNRYIYKKNGNKHDE